MKKFFLLAALGAVAVFSFVSCLNNDKVYVEQYYIAAILGDAKDDNFIEMGNSIAYSASSLGFGYAIVLMDSATDFKTQKEAISKLEKQSPTLGNLAGVILQPGNAEIEGLAASKIHELNVPLVCVESPVSDNTPLKGLYKTDILIDNEDALKLYKEAETAVDSLQQILVITQDISSSSRYRFKPIKEYAGNKLTSILVKPYDFSNIKTKIAEAIIANPEITTVVSLNGTSLSSEILAYLKDLGIPVYTFDYNQAIEYGLLDGTVVCAYVPDSEIMGYLSVEALLTDQTVSNPYYAPVQKITKDNIGK